MIKIIGEENRFSYSNKVRHNFSDASLNNHSKKNTMIVAKNLDMTNVFSNLYV